jgi:hypothetical protein
LRFAFSLAWPIARITAGRELVVEPDISLASSARAISRC